MQIGDFIKIDYVGRVGGEIFDLTKEDVAKKEKIYNPSMPYKPVVLIVGAGFVIPGLDEALKDVKVGEKKTIHVTSEKAFGPRRPDLVRVVPESAFKKQRFAPQPGLIVDFGGAKGRIQSVAGGRVRVDFNNPLAGKDVDYEIDVLEQIADPKEQIKGVLDFLNIPANDVSIKDDGAEIELNITRGFVHPKQRTQVAGIIREYVNDIKKIRLVEVFEAKESKETTQTG